jgi:O-antigen/teichoic acid export membrane protein
MFKKIKLLKTNQGFMKYFKNTSWLLTEKILRMVISFFVGIWLARYLGPERFGIFSYVLSFVGLFTAFTTLGLDSIVVRNLIKKPRHQNKLIGTTFLLKLIGAAISIILIAIAVNFTSNDRDTATLIFIVASSNIFYSFNVIDFYFQSQVLSRYIVYANIISLFISSILKIILLSIEAPLIAFVWVVFLDTIILFLGFIYFFFKKSKLKIKKITFSKKLAMSLMKESWPFMLSGVIISIYLKIDQVMIKEMLGTESVGQYAVAARLSEIWYFIPIVLITSLFPSILNAKEKSEEKYYFRLQQLYSMLTWLSITIALLVTFTADWVVGFLYGPEYDLTGSVLIVHVWSSIFIFFNIANSKWLLIEGLHTYRIIIDLFSTILNVLLNYVLIPKYGIVGAAWATLLSYSISILVIYSLIPNLRVSLKMFFVSFKMPIK